MITTDKHVFFWKSKLGQWNMKPFIETIEVKDKNNILIDTYNFEYCCAEQYMMSILNIKETYKIL